MKNSTLSLFLLFTSYAASLFSAAGNEPTKAEQKILDKIEVVLNRFGPSIDDGRLWKNAILAELRLNPESHLSREELKKDPHANALIEIAEIINESGALARTLHQMDSPFRQASAASLSDRARNALILEIQTRRPITPRPSRPADSSESDSFSDSFIGGYSYDEIGMLSD